MRDSRNFKNTLFKYISINSDLLRKYYWLWKISIRIYGIKKFDPKKFLYRHPTNCKNVNIAPNKYSLIFDSQCLQTKTRERGIGKYFIRLINSICKLESDKNFLAFFTNIAAKEEIEAGIGTLLKLNIANLDIVVLNIFGDNKSAHFTKAQDNLREALERLHSDLVFCPDNFETFNWFVPVPKSTKYRRIGILHDIIPLHFPKDLLQSNFKKSCYQSALKDFSTFDLIFANSEETKRDWDNLQISKSKVVVIYGAGTLKTQKENSMLNFRERSGILCVGAEQPHKNVINLIKAYSLLEEEIQLKNDLVITGIRSKGFKKSLKRIAKRSVGKVTFTDYLTDLELENLYSNSLILVVPSFKEGLSLPILEGWDHGLVTLGSEFTVTKELIKKPGLLFDPSSPSNMKVKISKFLLDEYEWNVAHQLFIQERMNFNWDITSRIVLNSIVELFDEQY